MFYVSYYVILLYHLSQNYKMWLNINMLNRLAKIFYNPQAWHNAIFVVNFYASFTLLLLILGENIFALVFWRGASLLTLHYSIYFGVDWAGSVYNFFIFSAVALMIFIINFTAANLFFAKKRILSHFLVISASFLLLFMLVIMSLLLYINWNNPEIS